MTQRDSGRTAGSPTGDRITLTGLEVYAYHGVHQFERDYGQRFVIDLTVHCDLSLAGRTDDLAATLDYGQLARLVETMVTTEPVNLLETLAENIAAAVFEHARTSGVAVETVEVTVHKPQAPLSVTFADVSVTVVRNRP